MENQKVVVRFDEACLREKYGLRRIEGTATVDSMVRLIDIADLHANPREAKVGEVTDDIQESLETTPQWFHFKSKGILIAAASCESRERNRYELRFEDGDIEGILDGGHNLLAIALHILKKALGDEADKVLRPIKRWEQVPNIWKSNRDRVEDVKGFLNFFTPIEIIYPQEGAQGRDEFLDAVLDVARARNNNAQLTEETKANKSGFYDSIKSSIDPDLVEQVEWKTNDGGRIKVRELVALSWIPLSRITDDLPARVSPDAIYRSKGACVAAFNKLLESDQISQKAKGEIRELHHEGVKSAISLLKDIPQLFDFIYSRFPDAYNNASPGFGRINSVRVWDPAKAKSRDPKYLPHPPLTKFYRQECKYDFPDGFIMPLMWALGELMQYKDGKVSWRADVNPYKFIERTLDKTLSVFYGMIQMANYDPQKVGKTLASYHLAANDFKSRLPRVD